jgi:hypothetical protein
MHPSQIVAKGPDFTMTRWMSLFASVTNHLWCVCCAPRGGACIRARLSRLRAQPRVNLRLVDFQRAAHAPRGCVLDTHLPARGSRQPRAPRAAGVITPAATDWSLGDISVTFSLVCAPRACCITPPRSAPRGWQVIGGFAWGAVLGKYLDRVCRIVAVSLRCC